MNDKYSKIDTINPLSCYSNKMMRCNRIIANIFRKHLKDFGITDSQLSILFYVTKSKEVNQKNICDFLVSEKSTTNRNINRLLDKGYLSIDKHYLITTENGKELLERIIPSWENAMEEVNEIIGKDGEDALNKIHSKLIKS
ncbi:MAG: MarR family winged helix-turn-helix transcriptional regulator [Melioribacteraceae bacterium]